MALVKRCPQCRSSVSPYAGGCPSCGYDLDAYRRRLAQGTERPRLQRPSLPSLAVSDGIFDLVVVTILMLLLALYAPLWGALLTLFVLWHSHHNGYEGRRNAAALCLALALFDVVVPNAIVTAVTY